MKRTLIIVLIIIVAAVGGGGIVYFYDYQNNHYITTDNAQAQADMVTITPQITGRITDWTAKVGDNVKAGYNLGTQETNTQLAMSGAAQMDTTAQAALSSQLQSKADVKSPIDGKIIQVTAVKGQLASTSTPLAIVADTDNAYVTAYIKETDIADVKAGQKVDVKFDAYKGKTFDGVIDNIGEAAQSEFSLLPSFNSDGSYTKVTQLIPVKISLKDTANYDIIPGINASVKIYKDVLN